MDRIRTEPFPKGIEGEHIRRSRHCYEWRFENAVGTCWRISSIPLKMGMGKKSIGFITITVILCHLK